MDNKFIKIYTKKSAGKEGCVYDMVCLQEISSIRSDIRWDYKYAPCNTDGSVVYKEVGRAVHITLFIVLKNDRDFVLNDYDDEAKHKETIEFLDEYVSGGYRELITKLREAGDPYES